LTEETKMPEIEPAGLVGRIADLLARLPAGFVIRPGTDLAPMRSGAPTGAERRARLALRIALLQRADLTPRPVPEEMLAVPVSQAETPVVPVVTPEAAPPPPPPRPKPARVSMSTLRLEDAALLLAAAAAPSDPAPPDLAPQVSAAPPQSKPDAETPRPGKAGARRGSGAVGDLGDAFAALSALGDSATPSEPGPVPPAAGEAPTTTRDAEIPPKAKPRTRRGIGGAKDLGDAFAALSAMGDDPPATDPAAAPDAAPLSRGPVKGLRRAGSVSAADGLANAAAGFAAMQMADAEVLPPARTPSAAEVAMAAGFAAFGDPD
jgi:hypothetical protein